MGRDTLLYGLWSHLRELDKPPDNLCHVFVTMTARYLVGATGYPVSGAIQHTRYTGPHTPKLCSVDSGLRARQGRVASGAGTGACRAGAEEGLASRRGRLVFTHVSGAAATARRDP